MKRKKKVLLAVLLAFTMMFSSLSSTLPMPVYAQDEVLTDTTPETNNNDTTVSEDVSDNVNTEENKEGIEEKKIATIADDTVAKIGDTEYQSLQDAINAVPQNGEETTIVIVNDMIIQEQINIERKKVVLTSEEAHTITFNITTSDQNCFRVGNWSNTEASLTISGNVIINTQNASLRSMVNVVKSATFILQGGILTSGNADLSKAIICVDNEGSLVISGGTIEGNKNHNSRGIFLQCSNGLPMTFVMSGGTIKNCSVINDTEMKRGAGIYVTGVAEFTMNGGTISNCSAKDGGAVTVANNGNFIMNNGTITDSSATRGGAVAVFDNGSFTMRNGMIAACSSENGNYVYKGENATFHHEGGTIYEKFAAKIGDNIYYTLKDAINAVPQNNSTTTTIEIVDDITISEQINIEKRRIELIANDKHTITFGTAIDNSNGFRVGVNSYFAINSDNLTITTTNTKFRALVNIGENGTFSMKNGLLDSGNAEISKAIICVDNGGTLEMSGGTVKGNKERNSRGVYLQSTDDKAMSFVMSGGTIKDCSTVDSAEDMGAGVRVIGVGKFTMNGGTISNCEAKQGGAISVVENAELTMNNGTVSDCFGSSRGGAVFIDKGVTFTMGNGTINNCNANNSGGAIYVQRSTFIINGGNITNCSATSSAGGVYAGVNSTFVMNNGTIANCSANNGGGVYIWENEESQDLTSFTMNGGTITNCKAKDGGGIYTSKQTQFEMTNGEVSANTINGTGAGLYIKSQKATISGGKIIDNTSDCNVGFGGGIYVEKEATLQLYNAVIKENDAFALGGGLWTCSTGDIKIYITDGGAVYDNKTVYKQTSGYENQSGDDISNFMGSGHLTLYNHMLGGGLNQYYKDGGVTLYFQNPKPDCDADRSFGTGAPSASTKRYGDNYKELYIDTMEKSSSVALKNVVSDEAKINAEEKAKVIISGNSASRGGGIGTNGNLIIGTPEIETYKATISKIWSDNTSDDEKTEISAYLVIGTQEIGPVKLNKSNGWKATFTGLIENPSEVKYSVKEVAVAGFKTEIESPVIDGNEITFTIKNIKDVKGGLTVEKEVSGTHGDKDQEFHFIVTLNDESINGEYGEMTFEDGVATFTLKHGETKTATGLPSDIEYTVEETEANKDGYVTTSTNENGNIPQNDNVIVTFSNARNITGGISVTKEVNGTHGDKDQEFHFTVTLNDDSINGTYDDITFEDGIATFTLKHGESKSATGLPADIEYSVEETEANKDGYVTTSSGDKGTIPQNNNAEVKFINEKNITGGLIVEKEVAGTHGDKDQEFHFIVTLNDESINGEYGEMTFEDGVATFTLKHGETKTATGLPSDIEYTVEETEANKDGYVTTSTNENGNIPQNDNAIVTFNNARNITGGITVTKEVSGTHGDKEQEFHFTVTLDDKTITGKYGDMKFTDGVAEITLKHGEKATATGLPAGIEYIVVEKEANDDGYTMTSTADKGTIPENDNANVKFTNHKEIKPDNPNTPDSPETGDQTNMDLYASILIMSGFLITVLALLRKMKAFEHR